MSHVWIFFLSFFEKLSHVFYVCVCLSTLWKKTMKNVHERGEIFFFFVGHPIVDVDSGSRIFLSLVINCTNLGINTMCKPLKNVSFDI